jgi:hypothetical protein
VTCKPDHEPIDVLLNASLPPVRCKECGHIGLPDESQTWTIGASCSNPECGSRFITLATLAEIEADELLSKGGAS